MSTYSSETSKSVARDGHDSRLPVHPSPIASESEMGYLLRLSQVNGFDSLWSLARRAGVEQHEFRALNLARQKFTEIADSIFGDLERMGYSSPTSHQKCRLLGHELIPRNLSLWSPKVCIPCIRSIGFIEAQWDLRLMVGCPIHGYMATSACLSCGDGLRWYRPGLARCHCGAKLTIDDSRPLTSAEGELLQIIRAKVLRLLPLIDASPGLPTYELQRFELRELLTIIRTLGLCALVAEEHSAKRSSPEAVLSAASRVLSEWPKHFYELLSALGQRGPTIAQDIRSQFAPLHSSLFKRKLGNCSEDVDFLRRAFLEFVCNHWDRRSADPKTLRQVSYDVPRRFATRTELARALGIDPRTLKRHRELKAHTDRPSLNARTIIDVRTFDPFPSSSGALMRIREAAREIGLPVEVLRALKASGEFEVHHQLVGMPGFRESDVRRFQARFADLASVDPDLEHDAGSISVRRAMGRSCQSVEQKVALIRALLQREIRTLGQTAGPISDLIILASDLETFLDKVRPGRGDVTTCQEAALMLNCEPSVVSRLIANGYLEAQKSSHGWQVTRASIAVFGHQFIRMSEIAKALGTSSRKLIGICTQHGIELCRVNTGGNGTRAFVPRSSVALVEAGYRRSQVG